MTRNDMKNPNQNETDKGQNLSGNQNGTSLKDSTQQGKSQGQKGSDWTPGDDSDVGTRFDQKRDDSDAKRGPGRNQDDTNE